MDSKIFEFLGLTENQILVYKEFLKLGKSKPLDVAKNLPVEKTTVYRAIEILEKSGLLIRTSSGKSSKFSAASPDVLKNISDTRLEEAKIQANKIDSFVERLKEQKDAFSAGSFVKVEKGLAAHRAGMRLILDHKNIILRQRFSSSAKIYDYSDHNDFVRKEFLPKRVKQKIFARQLVDLEESYVFDDIMQGSSEKLQKEIRILPGKAQSKNSMRIFSDIFQAVIHDEDAEEIMTVTVKNQFVADMMAEMFDFIWDRARRI